MIIVEFIKNLFWLMCRGVVWLFTSRDCEHCEWSYKSAYRGTRCSRHEEDCEECLNTIHRKHFERGRWFV